MTSAINIGLNIVNAAPPQTVSVQPSGEHSDFASLITVGESPVAALGTRIAPGSHIRLGALPETEAVKTADAMIGDVLSGLLEKLEALATGLKDDQPLDEDLLGDVASLLEQIDTQVQAGGALPLPETPAFEKLVALARELGLAPQDAESVNPLEVLSKLATKIADIAREQAPDIAVRLSAFARLMDGQSAAIETAFANAAPDAEMRKHLLGTEAQPNATKALQQADETRSNAQKTAPNATENTPVATAQPKESKPDSAPRSLVSDNGNAERPAINAGQNRQAAQAALATAAAGGAGAAADLGTQTETPDGLTLTSTQSATAAQAAAAARPAAAAYHRPDPQINMPHIAVEIARSIQNGINRFEIRLNPPELGRIDVRLEVDQSGNVVARLAVERSETLDLMQRDQRALEKALADAGLDSSKTDLEFSLKQQGADEREDGEKQNWRADNADAEEIAETNTQTTLYRGYARLDAVNLWV